MSRYLALVTSKREATLKPRAPGVRVVIVFHQCYGEMVCFGKSLRPLVVS